MWEVDNFTPFAALGDWLRDRDGAETWVVAVRGSFRIHVDGSSAVEPLQQVPVLAPQYVGLPGGSSLMYDSDFCITKPTTDVVLHGHAHAPGGQPTTRMRVGMAVGEVTKTLTVVGDRVHGGGMLGMGPSAPRPFVTMPIVYERAYGGPAGGVSSAPAFAANPVGCGHQPAAGSALPNLVAASGEAEVPVGFGPVPSHWPQRARYAGTYDAAWRRDRMPLYPPDLDERFFLGAPADQQPARHLRGGELVQLANLTVSGRQAFHLPQVALRFETEFRSRPTRTHHARLHSVIIEPEQSRVVMVWHTALKAHADVVRLQRTTVVSLRVINPRPQAVPSGLWFDEGIDDEVEAA